MVHLRHTLPKAVLLPILVVLLLVTEGCSLLQKDSGNKAIVLPSSNLTVYYLDVGEGDCTLIDYGTTEIIIDSGKKGSLSLKSIENYIDGDLEAIVATHPDADHIGNMNLLFDSYTVDTIYDCGYSKSTQVYKYYWNAVTEEKGINIVYPKRGNVLDIGGLSFLVLNPTLCHKPPCASSYSQSYPTSNMQGSYNNNSIALLLTYGDVNFYFMGDVEEDAESEIVDYFDLPEATYLKAGHHGSKTASSDKFLEEVKPMTIIYSAGRDNQYGHPNPETIERWEEYNATWIGTDQVGTIVVTTNGVVSNLYS